MTVGKGWGLPESHLLPDAVVAFVDQELSLAAQERAAAHLAHCPSCAAEVAAQRAASTAVRRAATPSISAGFLASLCEIPQHAELPPTPDHLAVAGDGQLMAVQRPEQVAGLRDGFPEGALGTSAPLGTSPTVLGNGTRLSAVRRRTTQGAGVVVSGLVLSALALVATTSAAGDGDVGGGDAESPRGGVLPARFGGSDTAFATATSVAGPGSTATSPRERSAMSPGPTPAPVSAPPASETSSTTSPDDRPDAPVNRSGAAPEARSASYPATVLSDTAASTTGVVMAPDHLPR